MGVVHDQKNKCFYILVGTKRAELLYYLNDDGVFDLYKTHVPEEGRGQGLAKQLVDAAVDHVKELQGKIKASCSYVEKYFEKNPELSGLRV